MQRKASDLSIGGLLYVSNISTAERTELAEIARDGSVTPGADPRAMQTDEITREIIGAAMRVHSELGPGLLESAYRRCLRHELALGGLRHSAELALPIRYKGLALDAGYRLDLLVEDTVIVELKAVRRITPVHEAQLLSYLKLSDCEVGLLINFHVKQLRDGIRRMVNGYGRRLRR